MRGELSSGEDAPAAGVLWRGFRGEFTSLCVWMVGGLVLRGGDALETWRVWRVRGEVLSVGELVTLNILMRGMRETDSMGGGVSTEVMIVS
jgi:hypothetical protein